MIVGGTTSSYDFPVTDGSRNVATQFAATSDDGDSWRPLGNLPAGTPWSLAVDSSKPPVWYATGSSGIFKSTDGGATWRRVGLDSPGNGEEDSNAETDSYILGRREARRKAAR